ncbi:hypothetical protein AB0I28_01510 [Phytomonospora sp. NPDC050363]|uniref:alpha/beta fold hydrolase n=1 Tax=Phytomonospora sp. NPDC050363 TaxID=3155642 RepID=UPI003403EC86
MLAVHGVADSADHIGTAERLVETVADGRSVFVEDAAHYPNMERPQTYDETLAAFLKGL